MFKRVFSYILIMLIIFMSITDKTYGIDVYAKTEFISEIKGETTTQNEVKIEKDEECEGFNKIEEVEKTEELEEGVEAEKAKEFEKGEETKRAKELKKDEEAEAEDTLFVSSADNCGENATYTLSDDGVLEISGVGKIADGAFANNGNIKRVIINNGITSIGKSCFAGCKNLSNITFADTITVIDGAAFMNCTSLVELQLPSKLEKIEKYGFYCAFYGCQNLRSVVVPKTLSKVESPFGGCNSLEYAELENGLSIIPDSLFADTGLKEVLIPDTVTSIGNYCFSGCTKLTNITLPNSLTNIGIGCFDNCSDLESITIPDRVTNIGGRAFKNCTSLSSVKLSSNLTTLGSSGQLGSFYGCTALVSIIIPKTVTKAQSPFERCSALKHIEIEDGMTAIPDSFFSGSYITNINLPSTVTSFGNGSFGACNNLTNIIIPDQVTYIGGNCFGNCENLRSVKLPRNLETLGRVGSVSVFYNCPNLRLVYMPQNCDIKGNPFERSYDVKCLVYDNSEVLCWAVDNDVDYELVENFVDKEEYVTNYSNTLYISEIDHMTGEGYVPMVLKYDLKSQWVDKVSDLKVVIKIPKRAELSNDIVLVNGEKCDTFAINDKNGTFTIPIDTAKGTIRYSIKVLEYGKIGSYVKLYYTLNGASKYEIMDVTNEMLKEISIIASDHIGCSSFKVSGVAPAQNEVRIYVDGEYNTTTTSSKVGQYDADIAISNPQECYSYNIEAVSGDARADKEVIYYAETPEIQSFDMYYNYNSMKHCDLLKENGSIPKVIYKPDYPFNFELKLSNPQSIEQLCVTSTRNGITKYIPAVYDSSRNLFVASGYFDNDSRYVPGRISYSYTRPQKEVKIDENYDFSTLGMSFLSADAICVNENTDTSYNAVIDLGELSKELANTSVEVGIKVFDLNTGGNLEDIFGAGKELQKILVKGENGKLFEVYKDDDKDDLYKMNYFVKEVSNSKIIKFGLSTLEDNYNYTDDMFWKLLQTESRLSAIGKASKYLLEQKDIAYDTEKLREKVMLNSSQYSPQELAVKLKQVDSLQKDREDFLKLFTIITLVSSSCGMVGAPAIMFTSMLSLLNISSSVFWNIRESGILGRECRLSWVVDPSGFVYDSRTKERICGVKCTAYYVPYDESADFWDIKPTNGDLGIIWNAEEYNQSNPLYTDEDGFYQWDVPEGWWRIKFEHDFYKTAWSEWMTVPPIQTEVNIPMEYNGISNARVDSVSLSLEEEISINFYLVLSPDIIETGNVLIDGVERKIPSATEDGTYRFKVPCSAKELGDLHEIEVMLNSQNIALDNESAQNDGTFKYCVREYIDTACDSSDNKLIKLAKALDAYGYYAQKYFNYKVPSTLPEIADVNDFNINSSAYFDDLPDDVCYIGSSLVLKNRLAIRHYFDGNISKYKPTVDGIQSTVNTKDGVQFIEISDVKPYNFSRNNIIVIDKHETSYGPKSYMQKVIDKSTDDNLKNLIMALYWYGEAAKEYFQ